MKKIKVSAGQIADRLKCGDCGSEKFEIFNIRQADEWRAGGGGSTDAVMRGSVAKANPPSDVAGYLLTVCEKGHKSEISVSRPSVTIAGNLCGGWEDC